MTVITAGCESEVPPRQQIQVTMRLPTTDSWFRINKDWFTDFDMQNRFDLALCKAWMARPENLHHVDHTTNTLQFLERKEQTSGPTVFSVVSELRGLRPEEDQFTVREKQEWVARQACFTILAPRQIQELAQAGRGAGR